MRGNRRGLGSLIAGTVLLGVALGSIVHGAQPTALRLRNVQTAGNNVYVTVQNPASVAKSGQVVVTAQLQTGAIETLTRSFTVGARSDLVVTVTFSARVVRVVSVSITEGPDPINPG